MIDYLKAALRIYQKNNRNNANYPELAIIYNNLAICSSGEEVNEYLIAAKERKEKYFGETHPLTAITIANFYKYLS